MSVHEWHTAPAPVSYGTRVSTWVTHSSSTSELRHTCQYMSDTQLQHTPVSYGTRVSTWVTHSSSTPCMPSTQTLAYSSVAWYISQWYDTTWSVNLMWQPRCLCESTVHLEVSTAVLYLTHCWWTMRRLQCILQWLGMGLSCHLWYDSGSIVLNTLQLHNCVHWSAMLQYSIHESIRLQFYFIITV